MPFTSLASLMNTGRRSVASEDYPELGTILEERPNPALANRHTAADEGLCAICNQEPATQEIAGSSVGDRCAEHLFGVPTENRTPHPDFGQAVYGQHTAGILDWLDRKLSPFAPEPGARWSYDWCRFRRNSHCFFPSHLDANATRLAGYAVWVPQDRGTCPRTTWDQQKRCPIGQPGPHSGDPHSLTDATVPWSQGGQRGGIIDVHSSLQHEAGTYELAGSWPPELPHEAGLTCPYCQGQGVGGRMAVAWDANTCGKCHGKGRIDARMKLGRLDRADDELHWHFCASWNDVRAKAKRIRAEAGVRIISAPSPRNPYIVAEVKGDHHTYQSTILRSMGSKGVAGWECTCAWAHYAWGRSGRWKKFEGRMCSHVLATMYQAQAEEMFGGRVKEIERRPVHMEEPFFYKAPEIRPWRVGSVQESLPTGFSTPVEIAPITVEARALLEEGCEPNAVLGFLREFGATHPERILIEAITQPFVARDPADEQHTVVEISGDHAITDAGEAIRVEHLTHPDFDWVSGLDVGPHDSPHHVPEDGTEWAEDHLAGIRSNLPDDHPSKGHVFEPKEEGSNWCKVCGHHRSVTKHKTAAGMDPVEVGTDEAELQGDDDDLNTDDISTAAMLRWARGPWDPGKVIAPHTKPGWGENWDATHFEKLPEQEQHRQEQLPKEQHNLDHETMVNNVIAAHHHAKQDPEQYEKDANWYEDQHHAIRQIARSTHANRPKGVGTGNWTRSVFGAAAALSPNTAWHHNLNLADYMASNHHKYNHIEDPEKASEALWKDAKKEGLRSYNPDKDRDEGLQGPGFKNMAKAMVMLRGHGDPNHALGGHKVRSFFNNLIDPKGEQTHESVTSDRHHMGVLAGAYLGGDAALRIFGDNMRKGTNTKGSYALMASATREAHRRLKESGEIPENWTPSHLQAGVWGPHRRDAEEAFNAMKGYRRKLTKDPNTERPTFRLPLHEASESDCPLGDAIDPEFDPFENEPDPDLDPKGNDAYWEVHDLREKVDEAKRRARKPKTSMLRWARPYDWSNPHARSLDRADLCMHQHQEIGEGRRKCKDCGDDLGPAPLVVKQSMLRWGSDLSDDDIYRILRHVQDIQSRQPKPEPRRVPLTDCGSPKVGPDRRHEGYDDGCGWGTLCPSAPRSEHFEHRFHNEEGPPAVMPSETKAYELSTGAVPKSPGNPRLNMLHWGGSGVYVRVHDTRSIVRWGGVDTGGISDTDDSDEASTPQLDAELDQASQVQKNLREQADQAQDDFYFNHSKDQKLIDDDHASIPTYMSALPHGASMQRWSDVATLHDEPEPALPSTDGDHGPSELWQREHSGDAQDPISAGPPGFGSPADPGYAHEDLGAPESDAAVLSPSSGPGAGSLVNETEKMFHSLDYTSSLEGDVGGAESRGWLLAGQDRNAGGDRGISTSDIAAQARLFLETGALPEGPGKTAAKVFTPAEQAELIHEGSDGVRASNLDRLQLEGTHYLALEDDPELEGLLD